MRNLIASAVGELYTATEKLVRQTSPNTKLPRPRFFEFAEGLFWPSSRVLIEPEERRHWFLIEDTVEKVNASISYNSILAVERIQKRCKHQPRLVLRALRRIQAAAAWCLARAEGRERQAEEILRQQAKFSESLEAEWAMHALKR